MVDAVSVRQVAILKSGSIKPRISLVFCLARDITYAIKFEQEPEVCRPDNERFTEWIMKIEVYRPW